MRQFLRFNQRELLQKEKKSLEDKLANPLIEGKGDVRVLMRRVDETLREESPPETTPERRDFLKKRQAELSESFRHGMPTSQELRLNAHGVPGRILQWEKLHKAEVLEWKNNQIELEPDSNDPDLASIEGFRSREGGDFNLDRTQIERKVMSQPSKQYMQNWPHTFGTPEEKAEAEAAALKLAELEAQVVELRAMYAAQQAALKPQSESKTRKPMSDEKKRQQSEKMKAVWARKRAEKAAATEEQPAVPA